MTDVLHFQTLDGGEIKIVNGQAVMDYGPGTAYYHCLFGGNDDDPGESDTTMTWWGNLVEADSTRHYRSRTQYLLNSLPATSANLKRLREAIAADIAAIDSLLGVESDIQINIPRRHAVEIKISNRIFSGEYKEIWRVAT